MNTVSCLLSGPFTNYFLCPPGHHYGQCPLSSLISSPIRDSSSPTPASSGDSMCYLVSVEQLRTDSMLVMGDIASPISLPRSPCRFPLCAVVKTWVSPTHSSHEFSVTDLQIGALLNLTIYFLCFHSLWYRCQNSKFKLLSHFLICGFGSNVYT